MSEDLNNINESEIEDCDTEKNETEENEKKDKKNEKITLRDVIETIIYLAVVFVLCLLFTRFVAYRCIVNGTSMERTFTEGDNCIAERISYYLHDPKRFEIVILDLEEPPKNGSGNETLIKRVIGLPGETLEIKGGYVYINGELLSEDIYALNGYTQAYPEIKLADDEFFVMGDNRDISLDSRSFGPVKKKEVNARILVRIWPLNRMGSDFKQP